MPAPPASTPIDPDRDPHLLAALRHAPDGELEAPAQLSARILAAAREAAAAQTTSSAALQPLPPANPSAAPARPTWHARLLDTLRLAFGGLHLGPAQATGLASVFLTVMIGLIWGTREPPPAARPAAHVLTPTPQPAPTAPARPSAPPTAPPQAALKAERSPAATPDAAGPAREQDARRAERAPATTAAANPTGRGFGPPADAADTVTQAPSRQLAEASKLEPTDAAAKSAERPVPTLPGSPPTASPAAAQPSNATVADHAPAPAPRVSGFAQGADGKTRTIAAAPTTQLERLHAALLAASAASSASAHGSPAATWRSLPQGPARPSAAAALDWLHRVQTATTGRWVAADIAPPDQALHLGWIIQGRQAGEMWIAADRIWWQASAADVISMAGLDSSTAAQLIEQATAALGR